ncbi:uncharacterized protein TNCV_3546251 [Trichonephila clavipes]|nr:uncharacterized protein TNCV_3546251 [Trichonephila clavipes]
MFQILLWSRCKRKKGKYRCGQRTVRLAVVACSQKQNSLRAQAQLSETKTETMRTETVETFELVKVEPKLWREEKGERERARATIDLLKDTLGDRLISRFGTVNWPPRSCDLTPIDYFLWGYVKSLVYADKPQTLDHLEDNIRRVIADIRPQMLEKVIQNWTSRLDYIRGSRGSHMPEIIFKM